MGLVWATLVACSGDPDPAPAEPDPTAATRPDLPDFSVESMLEEIPGTALTSSRFILRAADLRAASEMAGVELPTGSDEAPAWIGSLVGTGPDPQVYVALGLPLAPGAPAPMVEEDLGWSVADVERFISWGDDVRTTTVVAGRFDDETLAGLPEAGGIHSAGEGKDLGGSLETASPARPTGMPLRMRTDGSWLIASPFTAAVQDWRSDVPTLADGTVIPEMARLLDASGAYAAAISPPPPFSACDLTPGRIRELGLTLESFPEVDMHALAWSWSDGSPAMTVVYHDADGRGVEETRRLLEGLWSGPASDRGEMSDMVEVRSVDAVGENVVVSLRPAEGFGPEVLGILDSQAELPFCTR